jgi:hypothetical protein
LYHHATKIEHLMGHLLTEMKANQEEMKTNPEVMKPIKEE